MLSGKMPWKVRLIIIVPALLYLIHAGDDFAQSVGLLPKRPTELEAVIEAPRERVFDAFALAAAIAPQDCPNSCSNEISVGDKPMQEVAIELVRPSTIVRQIRVDDDPLNIDIHYELREEGDRTWIVSRAVYAGSGDIKTKQGMEHGYEEWGEREFERMVSIIRDAAQSDADLHSPSISELTSDI